MNKNIISLMLLCISLIVVAWGLLLSYFGFITQSLLAYILGILICMYEELISIRYIIKEKLLNHEVKKK